MRGGIDQHLIAKEGWWVIAVLTAVILCSYFYFPVYISIVLVLLLVLVLFATRNPLIEIPSAPLGVLCPASGKITSIVKAGDPWLSRSATLVQIKVGLSSVHTLRSPVEGKIMNEWSADCDITGYNRRYAYWFQTDEGDDIVISLLLGKYSPFTRMYIRSGERIGQGEYCGYLYFSGMVEVYMPESARINIETGSKISAGVDILSTFVHEEGITGLGK